MTIDKSTVGAVGLPAPTLNFKSKILQFAQLFSRFPKNSLAVFNFALKIKSFWKLSPQF